LALRAGLQGTKTLSTYDAQRDVDQELREFIASSTGPNAATRKALSSLSISANIKRTRGFMYFRGFLAVYYYEVELSPEMMGDIRAALSGQVESGQPSVFPESTPPWWPTQWPNDCRFYKNHSTYYLMLPDTGTKAWLMRVIAD